MRFMPHDVSDFQILRKIKSRAVNGYPAENHSQRSPWSCVFANRQFVGPGIMLIRINSKALR